jgi:hypothetical protein
VLAEESDRPSWCTDASATREPAKTASKKLARNAERKRRLQLEEGYHGLKKRQSPQTLKAAAAAWLELKQPTVTPKTHRIEKTHLSAHPAGAASIYSLVVRHDLQLAPNVPDDRVIDDLRATRVHWGTVINSQLVGCSRGDFNKGGIDLPERILIAPGHQRVLVKEPNRVGSVDRRNQIR